MLVRCLLPWPSRRNWSTLLRGNNCYRGWGRILSAFCSHAVPCGMVLDSEGRIQKTSSLACARSGLVPGRPAPKFTRPKQSPRGHDQIEPRTGTRDKQVQLFIACLSGPISLRCFGFGFPGARLGATQPTTRKKKKKKKKKKNLIVRVILA